MQSNKGAEAFTSINHKLSSLSKAHPQRFIYRVHKQLRNVNETAYQPEIIAIGPYHRDKDNLKMMEEHKLRYLQLLLERREDNVERYISAIGQLEQRARNCYAEPISLNAAEFVEMLVLDGCFIIELVRKCNKKDATCKNDPIFQMEWIMNSLQRDLILFENQIPFFILCKLFDLIEVPNKYPRLIYLLLFFCPNLSHKRIPSRSSDEIKHLLDLIYNSWLPSTDDVHLDIDNVNPTKGDSGPMKRELRFIQSVTELKDANVEFKKKESHSLFEVKFENGIMCVPPLTIEDRTECFLRNLIVYEQYFLNNQPNIITDYARFLDCLINSSKDVEILSQSEIIDNWLGDNEVIADIFNQLTDSIVGPGEHFYYAGTFDKINAHYKKGWNRSMALLRRDIFYSIWAYISFFAAFALLLLTITQTVCSILQVV